VDFSIIFDFGLDEFQTTHRTGEFSKPSTNNSMHAGKVENLQLVS
jgi:hypothetical protein